MKAFPMRVDEAALRARYPFASLVRPIGGVVENVKGYVVERGTPHFEIGATGVGNLTMSFDHVVMSTGTDVRNEPIGGAGADVDRELAWVKAAVEGIERYAMMIHAPEDFVVASAAELGSAAIDLERLPRCSEREYADPRCAIRPADPSKPIRWVKGYSLTARCARYVPAAMTHLYFHPATPERFTQQISTGAAAHTNLAVALVAGACEVIERDAIALTWLARLSLPRIEISEPTPSLAPTWDRLRRSLVRQELYDATTDLGVPTIWAMQTVDDDPRCRMIVTAATSFDAGIAVAKCVREAASGRTVLVLDREMPEDPADSKTLYDGAMHYARTDAGSDFDFLRHSTTRRSLADVQAQAPLGVSASPELQLAWLVRRFTAVGMEAIAVDLTTDELREAGLWVVRVIVPELMPITFNYRSRFLGTPRLYRYPEAAGFGPRNEADINPGPLPFA